MKWVPETLTVRDLIELLEGEDQDAKIVFASNYGDYAKTQQVHFLSGVCTTQLIEESGYSQSGWAIVDDEDDDEPATKELPEFLVLS